MAKPPDTDINGRYNHDEDLKIPIEEGKSPRPATEPEGSEESSRTSKATTDPQTGESIRRRERRAPKAAAQRPV